jgi:rhamnosyltransferase
MAGESGMSRGIETVTVVVRTKDEERWIGSCLRSVRRQDFDGRIEVVLVDNASTDRTLDKAAPFVDRVVAIEQFRPGAALNAGMRAGSGDVFICLSGHCIPRDKDWLARLVAPLEDPEVGGVYGRQEPLSYSSPVDKRDLLITFGLDRRVQRLDSFFHNANSAFRRAVWERFPFDEEVPNIEDRLWAREVLDAGFVLVYEPEASVYHHHGIHHGGDVRRAAQIMAIVEDLDRRPHSGAAQLVEDLDVVAIVPSRGRSLAVGSTDLLQLTLDAALASELVQRVVVATDDETTAARAQAQGVEVLRRPAELSEPFVGIGEVLQFAMHELEASGNPPDVVVVLEETHPFRHQGLVDDVVRKLVEEGLDSVMAVRTEARRLWVRQEDGTTEPVGASGLLPRSLRDSQTYLGLFGLCTATRPEFVREGSVLGPRLGLHEVQGALAAVEVRTEDDAAMIARWEGEGR